MTTPRTTTRCLRLFALALVAAFATSAAAQQRAADDDPAGMLGTVDGELIYTQVCQACHMPDGKGAVGAGNYPPLTANEAVASTHAMAATILYGRRNMPAFARPQGRDFFFEATWLTDVQIANVINYIRTHFGNAYDDAVTAEEVRALRPVTP